jgi:hypothetical protein
MICLEHGILLVNCCVNFCCLFCLDDMLGAMAAKAGTAAKEETMAKAATAAKVSDGGKGGDDGKDSN